MAHEQHHWREFGGSFGRELAVGARESSCQDPKTVTVWGMLRDNILPASFPRFVGRSSLWLREVREGKVPDGVARELCVKI